MGSHLESLLLAVVIKLIGLHARSGVIGLCARGLPSQPISGELFRIKV